MGSAITIICSVTSDCNLNCGYCYTRASHRPGLKIAADQVNTLVENSSVGFDSVEYCWHGGEPLLLGRKFYEMIVSAQKQIVARSNGRKRFINCIQSNCLLLDNDMLAFLKDNEFRIGSTFEAPPRVHLRNRPTASGVHPEIETYLDIFRKIKSVSLPLGLLCVITKENASCGEEIFNFFRTIGVDSYSLLPLIEVPGRKGIEPPTNQKLFELYRTVFDLWMNEPNTFSCIEPLDTMIRSLLGERPRLCSFASSCLKRMITINPVGNVLPCGSLTNFPLGNIFGETLIDLLKKPVVRQLRRIRGEAVRKQCGRCRYVAICRGGCREIVFWHAGDYAGEFPYCEARRRTYEYLESRLEKLISASRRSP